MLQADNDGSQVVEIVGRFEERESFTRAVEALQAAGFSHSDLSVLDTHESLEAAGSGGEAWQDTLAGLVGEVKYIGPITTAGLIAIATGPIGAAIAGAIAAGVTGLALRDLLQTAQATPHTEDFARALELGALLLWVFTDSEERRDTARRILESQGAKDVHLHRRAVTPA